MSRPTVAIVGRPNVGKSTLFNRLIGGRDAIVSDQAGTTRDRHFGDGEWNGRRFWLVDTGGLVPDSCAAMDKAIRQQVELALAEADLVLFVVDGGEGLHPVDQAIAERLRRARRAGARGGEQAGQSAPTTPRSPTSISSGWGPRWRVGRGGKQERRPARRDRGEPCRSRSVGRRRRDPGGHRGASQCRKVARSPTLLGEERYVVSPEAGTTRDAVDSLLRYKDAPSSSSIRPASAARAKVDDDVEFYSTLRTQRAIERADVCVLVVDAAARPAQPGPADRDRGLGARRRAHHRRSTSGT